MITMFSNEFRKIDRISYIISQLPGSIKVFKIAASVAVEAASRIRTPKTSYVFHGSLIHGLATHYRADGDYFHSIFLYPAVAESVFAYFHCTAKNSRIKFSFIYSATAISLSFFIRIISEHKIKS